MKTQKEHKKSTLRQWSKEELVDYCIMLEHNINAVSESLDIQYNNCLKFLNDMKLINKTYFEAKQIVKESLRSDNKLDAVTRTTEGRITMRDKLIELLQSVSTNEEGNRGVGSIADFLLENGVIVPPCKVGDTVYITITSPAVPSVIERKVVGFRYSTDMTKLEGILIDLVVDKEGNTKTTYFSADAINKIIFFTPEEAEKALEGVSDND